MSDARYEQAFIAGVTFTPIPSLWGHTAASNPGDLKFLNENVAKFLRQVASNAAVAAAHETLTSRRSADTMVTSSRD